MQVEATPTTDFVHGHINAQRGVAQLMELGLAQDLETAGLVRIKSPKGAALLRAIPNVPAAGVASPSSASPAVQVSPTPTVNKFAFGGKHRKHGG